MTNHATNAAEATKAIMQGWLASNAKDPAMQAIIQAAIDAATAELRAENKRLQQKLLDIAVRIHGDDEHLALDIAMIIQMSNPERGE